ncbi:vacuolar protein-sorting protein 11 [Acrasis kona]|uniref:Vacuolar protein-sorting protein 11 n=1 Tax=Acrasis kona TaxID=1008807 RepID=A0AAW2YPY1_9EUKA
MTRDNSGGDGFSTTFSFFENKTIKWREDKKGKSSDSPLQTARIVSSTSGKNILLFGEKNGTVHVVDTIHHLHNTFQAFDKGCLALKLVSEYKLDPSVAQKDFSSLFGGGNINDPVLVHYLIAIGYDKPTKDDQKEVEDLDDALTREEIYKVKVFELTHESFRVHFQERYFFYLLPDKKNSGSRTVVKNLRGELVVTCFEVSDDLKNMAVYVANAKQAPLNIYGEIIYFKMDSNQTFCTNQPSSIPVPTKITVNSSMDVTNIGFARIPGGGYNFYATTQKSVYCCIISDRFTSLNRMNFTVVDSKNGALARNATVLHSKPTKAKPSVASFLITNKILINTQDGIHQYGLEENYMPCNDASYVTRASTFRDYLVLATRMDTISNVKVYNLESGFVCHEYDLSHHLSSYIQSNQQTKVKPTYQVLDVLPTHDPTIDSESNGSIYLLIREMKTAQVNEDVLPESTNILFSNALDLARESQVPGLEVEIRQKYGDYRFSLGQYQKAVNQYMMTIGDLEPSYVIRKLLDETNTKNEHLIRYLYALHRRNCFNNDHTTLLINCMLRLDKDVKEQGEFSREMQVLRDKQHFEQLNSDQVDDDDENDDDHDQNDQLNTDTSAQEFNSYILSKDKTSLLDCFTKSHHLLHYDPVTVIKALKINNYITNALLLAEKFALERHDDNDLHDWVIRINIEQSTLASMQSALRHIESLSVPQAIVFLKRYAKPLVAMLPMRTTNVLIRMCTGMYKNVPAYLHSNTANTFDPNRIFCLFEYRTSLVENNKQMYKSSLDSFVDYSGNDDFDGVVANPSDYIYAFVDQPFWLMVFLEVVTTYMNNHFYNKRHAGADGSSHELDVVVYNTLLELYIKYWNDNVKNVSSHSVVMAPYRDLFVNGSDLDQDSPDERFYDIYPIEKNQLEDSYEQKARTLIERDADRYDPHHALMLCQNVNFEFGILHLYKRLGLKYDVLQYHIDQIPHLDKLRSEDDDQDELDHIKQQTTKQFNKILETAFEYGDDDHNVWVLVLSFFTSARTNQHPDNIDYIIKILQKIKEKDVVPPLLVVKMICNSPHIKVAHLREYLHSKLHRDQDKTKEQNKTIKELTRENHKLNGEIEELRRNAQIFQSTQCTACLRTLNLPSVHFMCMHSYHQRCLEGDSCPKCADKNKVHVAELDKIKRLRENKHQQDRIDVFSQQLKDPKLGFEALANQFGNGLFLQPHFEDHSDDFWAKSDTDRFVL